MERHERDAQVDAQADAQADVDFAAKHEVAMSTVAEHTAELELTKPDAPEAEQIHAPV